MMKAIKYAHYTTQLIVLKIKAKLSKFLTLKNSPGARENFPWLYYRNPTLSILQNENKLNFQVSIDKRDPLNFYKLDYVVYVYALDGSFIGIFPLTDQLSLCSKKHQDGHRYREFQTSYVNECEINVENFLAHRNNTIEFYEVFMRDPQDKNNLIDIPVRIVNTPNVLFPGKLNNETAVESQILVRRFFLIDNVSGIQGDGNFEAYKKQTNKKVTPFAIRYPSKIKLTITLRNIDEAKIFVPVIEIFYKSKLVSSIPDSYLAKLSLIVDYDMDITSFNNTMLAFLITLTVIVIIGGSIKFNVWRNTHPKLYDPVSFKFIFNF